MFFVCLKIRYDGQDPNHDAAYGVDLPEQPGLPLVLRDPRGDQRAGQADLVAASLHQTDQLVQEHLQQEADQDQRAAEASQERRLQAERVEEDRQ